MSGDFVLQGLDHPQAGQDHLFLAPSVGRGAESAHCGFGLQCKLEVSLGAGGSRCGAHAGGIQSVEHPWCSNCFILSGQVLHRVKTFKIQAGNQSLEPGCGLSVSLGVRGDSSSPYKVAPMPSNSCWTSSPFTLHWKSQIVCTIMHHGLSTYTLQTPSTVGMLSLPVFVEGDVIVQGPAGLHVFTAPGTHLGKHLQAPPGPANVCS